jgi:N-formylglutamate deformylase
VTLPLLLSVPHAGLVIPPEVSDICVLDEDAVIKDGDEGAAEIYLPLKNKVKALVTTDVARAIVDMNRAENDRRKDGVVKTHTCWDVPIYSEPLSDILMETLLEQYYRPYHQDLVRLADNVVAGIDCHTMAAVGPPVGPDPGLERPAACLSNADGTCPLWWLESLSEIMELKMKASVAINAPFRGGHIIRRHARKIPWLQVELSRSPFLDPMEKSVLIFESLQEWLHCLHGPDGI